MKTGTTNFNHKIKTSRNYEKCLQTPVDNKGETKPGSK